ncbi:MAG: class I SAM-dependent methyltransferase [Candidatus Sumerlaeota bacterium]|nr:class I SAM-dependent methyltransferase [Candidatus Sumerlaeota bacterium]
MKNSPPSQELAAPPDDIAGRGHWDDVYRQSAVDSAGWRPLNYEQKALAHALEQTARAGACKSILEVGCGNSCWLPYLASVTGARVAGIDYSEEGCALARRRMEIEGVKGEIHCVDIFAADAAQIGRHDLVFSLGLVEHFSDLQGVISQLLKFVAPGGILFTEVPNLRSMHGLLAWIWQPALLAKHKIVGKKDLLRAYEQAHLELPRVRLLGLFSWGIVAWGLYPRWPRLATRVDPAMQRVHQILTMCMAKTNIYWGAPLFAPFIYAVGSKAADGKIVNPGSMRHEKRS